MSMSANDGQMAAITTTVRATPMLHATRPRRWSRKVEENTPAAATQRSSSS